MFDSCSFPLPLAVFRSLECVGGGCGGAKAVEGSVIVASSAYVHAGSAFLVPLASPEVSLWLPQYMLEASGFVTLHWMLVVMLRKYALDTLLLHLRAL